MENSGEQSAPISGQIQALYQAQIHCKYVTSVLFGHHPSCCEVWESVWTLRETQRLGRCADTLQRQLNSHLSLSVSLSPSLSLALSLTLSAALCFLFFLLSLFPRCRVLFVTPFLRSAPLGSPARRLVTSLNCIRSTARLDIHDLSIHQR